MAKLLKAGRLFETPWAELALILIVALISFQAPAQTGKAQAADSSQVEAQVRSIRGEAERIDAAIDAPAAAGFSRITKQLPHWDLLGLFQNSVPVFLSARFLEGQLVRDETYYFHEGQPILVRVEKWWDIDEPARAPQPRTQQEFYLHNDQILRHRIRVGSTPPVTHLGNTDRSSDWLIRRSSAIAQILLGGSTAGTIEPLKVFPSVD
jgi:hypothetical protein